MLGQALGIFKHSIFLQALNTPAQEPAAPLLAGGAAT
jgi:hypothetical protein